MVLTSTDQEVRAKIDLAELTSSTTNTTDVTTARETRQREIILGEEYGYLNPPIKHEEPISVCEITSPQRQESVSKETSEISIPPLEWPVRAHPVFTNKIRTLLRTLWAIVVSRSIQLRFPISKTVISVFKDPAEGESKAILRLSCGASISQTLAFWDSLESDLQDWLNNLTEYERVVFITKISLRMYWL